MVVVDTEVTRGCELWRNYSLNLTLEIEKYVVELSYGISDGGSVDSELCMDRGIPRVVLNWLTYELLWISERGL